MSEDINVAQEQFGTITFANEVIATIAGLAACDIPGVAGMSGGFVGGITEMLGKKNLAKGVKVAVDDNKVTVDFQIIVDYGVRVPEVCANIQESVTKALETMTGLTVEAINITIQGVKFKEISAPAAQEEQE